MKTAYHNMWDTAKAMLEEKFVALNTNIKKEERAQTSYPSFHLKKLDKEEQINANANRKKEIIKIKTEINEVENRKTVERISATKAWINLYPGKKEKTESICSRNKRVNITTDPPDMNRIVRKYYEQLSANDFFKLEEMGNFHERHKLPKVTSKYV